MCYTENCRVTHLLYSLFWLYKELGNGWVCMMVTNLLGLAFTLPCTCSSPPTFRLPLMLDTKGRGCVWMKSLYECIIIIILYNERARFWILPGWQRWADSRSAEVGRFDWIGNRWERCGRLPGSVKCPPSCKVDDECTRSSAVHRLRSVCIPNKRLKGSK